jgi:hypothetical protein
MQNDHSGSLAAGANVNAASPMGAVPGVAAGACLTSFGLDGAHQNVALSMADWSPLKGRASITVFNDHNADPEHLISRLLPFDAVCVMRERTPMTRAIIERLPKLRLIFGRGSADRVPSRLASEQRRLG